MAEPLRTKVGSDLTQAIKSRDKIRVRTLRSVKAALQLKASEKGHKDITDEVVIAVFQKQAKQRREAMEQFQSGGRDDLFDREKEELAVLEAYLPKKLSDAEIEAVIDEVITSINAASPADMGRVMGQVMPRVSGRADGNVVRTIVAGRLSQ